MIAKNKLENVQLLQISKEREGAEILTLFLCVLMKGWDGRRETCSIYLSKFEIDMHKKDNPAVGFCCYFTVPISYFCVFFAVFFVFGLGHEKQDRYGFLQIFYTLIPSN